MSIRPLIVLLAVFPAATLLAQAPLPPDINPVTLSRLPPVTPGDLDAEGQRLLAALFREHKVSSDLWRKSWSTSGASGQSRSWR
jgi:hypothetical protein